MKRQFNRVLFSVILLASMAFARVIFAQAPPPPPSEKGTGSNKAPGGGAPVDGGILIALASVAGFGAWKVIRKFNKSHHHHLHT
ncbi:MAG: hypothetical protein ACOYNC_18795 [Bacteroidales bacterium]